MKKFLTILLILFACVAFAQQSPRRDLLFAWDQTIVPDLAGWKLYMSETAGSGYVEVAEITYGGTPTAEYTTDFEVIGSTGQVKQYYFVLTAFDLDGNESGYSNEVQAVVDFEAPDAPFTLRVTITRQP